MKILSILTLAAASALFFSGGLLAHDMWAVADSPQPGQKLKLSVGYGHHYPALEAIPAEELPFFQVKLTGPSGDVPITPAGSPNYEWATSEPAPAGAYIFVSDVKPIFWSQLPGGEWKMLPKNEATGAVSCGYYIESAKGVINVGAPADSPIVSKPVGLPLEIVPKTNPGSLKAGGKLELTVYLDGKPAPGVEIKGRYAGFDELAGSPDAKAFTTVTNPKGGAVFVPLAPGDWLLTATSEKPFDDLAKCDKTAYGTSLYLTVGK
jgi:uncharacterized GH25 family protein